MRMFLPPALSNKRLPRIRQTAVPPRTPTWVSRLSQRELSNELGIILILDKPISFLVDTDIYIAQISANSSP
jgi:hypothetical protein